MKGDPSWVAKIAIQEDDTVVINSDGSIYTGLKMCKGYTLP